ncbi:integrase core domain-containing protein [Streptomyces poriticola]|uniref:integrase core domain-containing protein n=1 Tax=Streptomyces poriticola TaxID=3120506 RepID=UPI0038CDC431
MESTIGLFKTEVVEPQRQWKTLWHVEAATVEWVDWYNHRRLHGESGTPGSCGARRPPDATAGTAACPDTENRRHHKRKRVRQQADGPS